MHCLMRYLSSLSSCTQYLHTQQLTIEQLQRCAVRLSHPHLPPYCGKSPATFQKSCTNAANRISMLQFDENTVACAHTNHCSRKEPAIVASKVSSLIRYIIAHLCILRFFILFFLFFCVCILIGFTLPCAGIFLCKSSILNIISSSSFPGIIF